MGSTRKEGRQHQFHYIHSVVDDHSGVASSEVLTYEKDTTCAELLLRAAT